MESKDCAFLILAGGKSRRMGQPKAELPIGKSTFLTYLIEKGKYLGFGQVIVSGYPVTEEGVLALEDVLKERGPLGGLYSCFTACELSACFVISVDVPLISVKTIRRLLAAHEPGRKATLLEHEGIIEPLIGVYSIREPEVLGDLLRDGSVPVLRYVDHIGSRSISLLEPITTIANFNTPGDFAALEQMKRSLQAEGEWDGSK